MAHYGYAVTIDVVTLLQVADYRARVVGVVLQHGRLRASAALPCSATVVARDDHAAVGKRPGHLTEYRDAVARSVAIGRLRTRNQYDRRTAIGIGRRRTCRRRRHRRGKAEAVRLHADRFVSGVRLAGNPGRCRGQVLADHVERRGGDAQTEQAPRLVHPDLGRERPLGVGESQTIRGRDQRPFGGVDPLCADSVDA